MFNYCPTINNGEGQERPGLLQVFKYGFISPDYYYSGLHIDPAIKC
jgi:hypothetical protein